jgi:hypothetical protein
VVLAGIKADQYQKASDTGYISTWTLQNIAQGKSDYELKKIVLTEQEQLKTSERELHEAMIIADEAIKNNPRRYSMWFCKTNIN